jgi:cytochrome c oxidase subunit 2
MNWLKDLAPQGSKVGRGAAARTRRQRGSLWKKRFRSRLGRKLRLGLTALAFTAAVAGRAHAEDYPVHAIENIFHPTSAPAETLYRLSILVLAICAGIFVIVAGLLTYAIIRYRRRGPEDDTTEPPQVYGSVAIELAWTIPPILIVVVLALVTARTIGELSGPRPIANNEALRIIGHRFWWEVRYPRYQVVTANEIHVPIDSRTEPGVTELTLESADVAHGFWVPQLNGKSWVVPNYRNQLWIKPYEPGIYLGNCTVLCGAQHANMLIRVIVESRKDYDQWLENQQKGPVADPNVGEGRKEFVENSCGTCHHIQDVGGANGTFGPDLTHFMSRATLGSGVAPNDEQNLRAWLKDPQVLKPGCLMPNMKLGDKEVDLILAYLRTLK